MRRAPLFWLALACLLGIATAEGLRPLPWLALSPLLLLPLLQRRPWALALCLFVLGASRHAWVSTAGLQAFAALDGEPVTLVGQWLSPTLLKTEQGLLHLRQAQGQVGRRAQVEGVVSRPPHAPLGGYDARTQLAGQGVYWQLEPTAPWVDLGPAAWSLAGWLATLRGQLVAPLKAYLPGKVAELLAALLFGEGQVPPATRAAFAEAGAAHLLAISGTHLSLGVYPLLGLLHAFGLPRARAAPWVLPWLTLYALLAGLQAPVARAAVMGGLSLLSFAFDRPRAGLNGLGLAALALLLVRPAALFTVSFQFSFAATFGILLLGPALQAWLARRLPRPLAAPLAVGLAAQLFVEPLALYHFGSFSPVGVISNLLLVPLASVVIPLGLLLAVLGALWLPLAWPLAWLSQPLAEALLGLVDRFAALPFGYFRPGPIAWHWLPLWFGALLCLRLGRWPPKGWAVVLVAVLVVRGVGLAPSPGLQVWFLDVGQGDAIALRTPGGAWWLIDGGRPEVAEAVVLPFLRRQGVRALQGVLVTHGDADHAGGLGPVVAALPVAALYGNGWGEEPALALLGAVARAQGVPLISLVRGQGFDLGDGVVAEVLHPERQVAGTARNEHSVVLRVSYEGVTLLLTGDLEGAGEAALLRCCRPQLAATVLKVAHHGSSTSTGPAFLEAVGPRAAVIPVGPNFYGHPHPAVLARLKAEGITLYRTDRQGHLSLMIEGGQLRWRGRGLGTWLNAW